MHDERMRKLQNQSATDNMYNRCSWRMVEIWLESRCLHTGKNTGNQAKTGNLKNANNETFSNGKIPPRGQSISNGQKAKGRPCLYLFNENSS